MKDCNTEQCAVCEHWGHNDSTCSYNKVTWAQKLKPAETIDLESDLHEGDADAPAASALALDTAETHVKLTSLDEVVATTSDSILTQSAVASDSRATSVNAAAVAEADNDSAAMSADENSTEQWQTSRGRKRKPLSAKVKKVDSKADKVAESQSPNKKQARKPKRAKAKSITSVATTADTVIQSQAASNVTPQDDVIQDVRDSAKQVVVTNDTTEPRVPSIIHNKQDISITERCFQSEDDDGEEETNLSMNSESSDSDGSLRPS